MGSLLFAIREVLLPFFLAAFLAYLIAPAVDWLSARDFSGRKLPRWGAVITLYLGVLVLVWASAVFVVPQLYGELERLLSSSAEAVTALDEAQLEKTAKRLDRYAERFSLPIRVVADGSEAEPEPDAEPEVEPEEEEVPPRPLGAPFPTSESATTEKKKEKEEEVVPPPEELVWTVDLSHEVRSLGRTTVDGLQQQTGAIVVRLRDLVGGALGFVFSFFLVLMITAFLTSDTDRIKQFFFSIVPTEDRQRFDDFLGRVDRGLSGVVRGQLTICLVNGVLTLIGLLLFEVKFAFLLATVAAVFSLIPIFGSIASTIPIVIVAAATSGLGIAVVMVAWIVGIHLLEANLLNPKIMGDAAKIHPVIVVLALIAGEHFYGIVGALFAVPLASVGVTLYRSVHARLVGLEAEVHKAAQKPAGGRPPQAKHFREPLG
jgi:predicted PurR-regulated permease PerM